MVFPIADTERFLSKVSFGQGPDACWIWQAALTTFGYGAFGVDGTSVRAHCAAYEAWVGPRDPNLVIDHVCRNRACINPAHLRQITSRRNTLIGTSIQARNARKRLCKRGHEFTPANTYRSSKGRECVKCRQMLRRRWRAKQGGAA